MEEWEMSSSLIAALSMAEEIIALTELIDKIKSALGTEENGDALIEVARNAHKAEMELASYHNLEENPFGFDGPTGAE
jgi:hypothetical protein